MSDNLSEIRNTFIMTWCIENFSSNTTQKGEHIASPPFSEEENYGLTWTLKLYPKGWDNEAYIAFSVYTNANNVSAGFIVSIIASDGSQLSKEKNPAIFRQDSRESCIHDFLKRDYVNSKREYLLPNDTLTLRCVLKRPVKQKSVYSQIKIEKLSFSWIIRNFSELEVKKNKLVHPFTIACQNPPDLKLGFCLVGETISEAHAFIDCEKMSKYRERFKYNYGREPKKNELSTTTYFDAAVSLMITVSILDAKGKQIVVLQSEHLFAPSPSDEIFQLPALMKRSDLIAEKSKFLPNDELNLQISLQISNGNIESLPTATVQSVYLSCPIMEVGPVHTDLGETLFNEKKFCDIVLTIGNDSFNAHKAVLCSQSPVFCKIMEADKSLNVLKMGGMDMETLKLLLLYMYTSKVDESLDYDTIKKLNSAAHEYKIELLKAKCSSIMITKITTENVWDVLVFASKFGNISMTQVAKVFISKHLDDSFASDGWMKMVEGALKQSE